MTSGNTEGKMSDNRTLTAECTVWNTPDDQTMVAMSQRDLIVLLGRVQRGERWPRLWAEVRQDCAYIENPWAIE